MSTPTSYRLRIRNAADDGDLLEISSVRTDPNPFIASVPSGDGEGLDPLTGQVTVGAYTVQVIDAEGAVEVTQTALSDTFESYADSAALLAVWTETDPGGIATWTLDTVNPQTGAKCAKLTLNGTVTAGQIYKLSRTVGSLTPGDVYAFRRGIYADAGNPPFPTNVWFDANTQLVVDGSGNLEVYLRLVVLNGGTASNWHWYFDDVSVTRQTTARERVVTGTLSDGEARQQLLSKKAFIEISENGGVDWDVMLSGYVNRVALVNANLIEFTIGESKRVEHSRKAFDRIPTADQYAAYETVYGSSAMGVLDRASCLIGGPIVGDWGPSQDRGRPTFKVERVEGQYVALKWVEGFVSANFHEREPPLREDVSDFINQAALEYLDSTTLVPQDGFSLAPCPGLVCRLYHVSTGAHVADLTPMAASFDSAMLRRMVGDWFFTGKSCLFWVRWVGTPPGTGTRYRVAVFPRSISSRNPFHWSGHPVDLAAQLFAVSGIAYDAASQDSVKAALGSLVCHLRITQSDTLQAFLEQTVYGPFGFATRRNVDGEEEFFQTRTSGQTPVATVTLADLYSSDGTAWELEEASAANKVVWESKSFLMNDAAGTVNEGTPIDCVLESTITVEVEAEDAAGQAVFGEKEVRFTLPGEIQGYNTGSEDAPGSLDLFVAAIAKPLFDWNGRGAIRGEFHVGRWSPAYAAVIGQELIVNCPHIPSAAAGQTPTSQRGTFPRRGFILHKTVSPSGAAFKLEDRGLAEILPVLPTFTLAPDATFPKRVAEVTITNESALDTAGVTVRVEMTTSGSATAGQYVRSWTPITDDNPFDLPAVCSGSVVYVRMRAEGTGEEAGTFGPWTAFASLDLADLTAPSALTATAEGTTLHLAWTNGEADVPVEVRYRVTAETLTTSAIVLPPGSTSYDLHLPTASTSYTVTVRHLEAEGCASAVATVVVDTDVQLALAAPIDPTTFSDGYGHHGLEVTATVVDAPIEFYAAAETAVGSGVAGTYALIDTAPAAAGRVRLQHPTVAPQDGKLWYWKARHIKVGWAPSAYTPERSVNPWAYQPPVDPEVPDPGDPSNPTGVTSQRAAYVELPLHAAGGVGFRLERVPSTLTAINTEWTTYFDATAYRRVRINGRIRSAGPSGSLVTAKFSADDGATFVLFDPVNGPTLALDATGTVKGEWVTLPPEANADIQVQAWAQGGDDASHAVIGDLTIAFDGGAVDDITDGDTPETPPPETQDPDGDGGIESGCVTTDTLPVADGLIAWHIADCGTFDAPDPNDKPVLTLTDLSGTGNTLSDAGNPGTVRQGTVAGGLPTQNSRYPIWFQDAYLTWPTGMFAGVTEGELFVVLRVYNRTDPSGTTNHDASWHIGGSGSEPQYGEFSTGKIKEDFGSNALKDMGDPSPDLTVPHIFNVRAGAGLFAGGINGTDIYSTGTNTVAWQSTPFFGNNGDNSRILVWEIAIYNRVLSSNERALVMDAMNDRWNLGLTITVPTEPTGTDSLPVATGLLAWHIGDRRLEVSGTDVLAWRDNSGNGNDLTGVAGSYASLETTETLNGRDTLKIDGDYLTWPTDLLDGLTGLEGFLVVKKIATSPTAGLWRLGADGAADTEWTDTVDGHIYENFGRSAAVDAGAPITGLTADWRLYNVRSGATGIGVLLDNRDQFAATATGAFATSTAPVFGRSGASTAGKFYVAEIVLYGRVLTTTEREKVVQRLKSRWDLADVFTPVAEEPETPNEPPAPVTGDKSLYVQVDPADLSDYPPFTGVWGSGGGVPSPGNIVARLSTLAAGGDRYLPYLLGTNDSRVNGSFNFNYWYTNLLEYATVAATLKTYFDNGTLLGVIAIDEPQLVSRWGYAIPWSTVDEMARRIKAVLGFNVRCYLRQSAVDLERSGYTFKYVDGAICQYSGALSGGERAPTMDAYILQQKAAALRLGKRVVWGMNLVNGGSGESGIRGSGNITNGYFLSAREIRDQGGAAAREIVRGFGDGLEVWMRDWQSFDLAYLQRTDIQAAFDYVNDILVG